MILHTVKTSPFQTLAIVDCLALMAEQDTLLLIEDAVIAAQAKHASSEQLALLSEQGRLMVLDADLLARGIQNNIGKVCSYTDFVKLVVQHKSQIAW
ncbi:sulfurtransferase complex subunit TusB [Psychromonas sp. PT13]|uniref:sulfurtransferase complex subunit TusB n=1 Tax=Psychromonas sp. PT13 TaxID=3439547 RepID=UPI003EC11CEA